MGDHTLIYDQDFLGTWQACCSCGWESSRRHETEAEAVEDFDNHCDVVFMEATRD